jgi:hypothetical protein
MVSFLDGAWLRKPQAPHCREVGRALAEMHVAGSDFPIRRANGLTVGNWRPLWEGSRERADEVQPGLRQEIDLRSWRSSKKSWPAGLPEGVIHADLFPDNVFFIEDRLSGLIDFYFACNDYLAYDVAICLNAWCFEARRGVQPHQGHGADRRLCLRAAAGEPRGRGASIARPGRCPAFFLTRLHDWLTTPEGALVVKKDPLEYLRKLRFPSPDRIELGIRPSHAGISYLEARRNFHRRRLLGQSRSRRLGRHPAPWHHGQGNVRRRSGNDQQPHGIAGGDHRAQRAQGRLRGRSPHRQQICHGWHFQSGFSAGRRTAGRQRRQEAREERRAVAGARSGRQPHKVTWHWVKGHAGHPENERADELAREGMAALQEQNGAPKERRKGIRIWL